jgi:hypothetical protein
VFATNDPDSTKFLQKAMRGIDWRNEVKDSVEYFHNLAGMPIDNLAAYIRNQGIHILLDWDGYANQGIRSSGLLPTRVAPIQICHQVGKMCIFLKY